MSKERAQSLPSLERDRLDAEIAALRRKLEDAEYTLSAITTGRVDALVIEDPVEERQVLLLARALHTDRLLVDRLRQGAVMVSEHGDVLHANPPFATLLGLPAAFLLGRPFSQFVTPRDHAALAALLDQHADSATADIRLEAPQGSSLSARVVCVPFAEGGGTCLIVTRLQESEDNSRETVQAIQRGEIDAIVVSETADDPKVLLLGAAGRRYRLLVEQMRDGAVTLSSDGDVLYANPQFAAILGVSPNAIVGTRLADFLEDRDRPLLDALLDGRRGPGSQAEVTVRREDGATFQALLTPVPAADEHGVSLILTDLTSKRRLDEAEETLRAIGSGEVDAFVVERSKGADIEMLSGAHRPYRLMVEKMQQGAVTLSASGEILYTNQPFSTMVGCHLVDLIGTRLEHLVADADRALLTALIVAPQGAASQGELTLLHSNGTHVSALVSVGMLPDEGGVCLIVTDLTKQKAYEALVAAQALERSILDQAIDAIVLCDPEGRVLRASRAAFELCGRNPLLLSFQESFSLTGANGPPDLAAVLAGAATLRSQEYTLRRSAADATVLLSAGPLVDGDGRPRGCVVTMSDITQRREAEDRLRASDRHKDEFLAILAHELRNPLAPIRSAVEILRNSEVSNPHAAYAIEIIGRQSANLIRLVDDLLDINRISQGKIALQIGLIDMRKVVEQAVETCRPLFASRDHSFETLVPSTAVPVKGDTVRLTQVVVNLLTNAANYTPPAGRIELALQCTNDRPPQAVVTVTDDGVGIPADMVARIFEPYQQASRARERATGGLGLGLTVCRRLMEMHGGSVEAFSDGPGRGARFVARLALAEGVAAEPAAATAGAQHGRALRVLVVDDNRDACDTLAQLMQLSGHEVRAVGNGAAALASATERLPDVVLLDIGMPGMDGHEVARQLRLLPGGSSVRVIAMTGYGSLADRHRSVESGIDHHLVKPVDFAALQNLLHAGSGSDIHEA